LNPELAAEFLPLLWEGDPEVGEPLSSAGRALRDVIEVKGALVAVCWEVAK
jgi:hypothetical protein